MTIKLTYILTDLKCVNNRNVHVSKLKLPEYKINVLYYQKKKKKRCLDAVSINYFFYSFYTTKLGPECECKLGRKPGLWGTDHVVREAKSDQILQRSEV